MEQAVENPRQAGQYQDRVKETLGWYKGFPQIGEQLRQLSTKVDEQTFYQVSEFVANYEKRPAVELATQFNQTASYFPERVRELSSAYEEKPESNDFWFKLSPLAELSQ